MKLYKNLKLHEPQHKKKHEDQLCKTAGLEYFTGFAGLLL